MATESEQRLLASLAAHMSWANTTDRSLRTAPARAALDQRFLDAADGDPVRAAHLRKAHFKRLALKSAQARRRLREATATLEAAETETIELLTSGDGPAGGTSRGGASR
ncbi:MULTISPECIES: hypothetical protein [Mumia]|uniref:CHAD domain-containing protein n=1 Tax=Mumia xiangluensis TaxID=1678900 RepID=A0ABW1QK45_9ACTN|nr:MULTISPECIES: hypothetical protein [Mumia]